MKWIGVFFLCITAAIAQAQVSFTASATRDGIALNERLRVEFKMDVDGDNFLPPNFNGFQVVSGPVTSVQQRYVNGVGSFAKSYTYILAPQSTGSKTIGQATMNYKGQEYRTSPFSVQITKAIEEPRETAGDEPVREIADQNIHLVAEVSNASPYLNEAIRVTYKLYVSNNAGINGWTETNSPKYADFWSENIDNRDQQVRVGTYQGKQYRYLVLREAILYPQKTGKLTIEPLELDVNVQVPSGRTDFFGRSFMTTEKLRVTAGGRAINVKDLPQEGRPASFTGAVGQFDFAVNLTKPQLEAGESLTASVVAKGTGNLQLMQLPKLEVPNRLETYEPERVDNTNTTYNGIRGSIQDNYTIVPQYGGTYTLPSVEFSYFDPAARTYKTITSGESQIEVTGDAFMPQTSGTNVLEADETFAFIKTTTDLESADADRFFDTLLYWCTLGGLFLLIPIFLLVRKRQEVVASDVQGRKIKTANKLSKKYLSEARKNMGNSDTFYESLERALHNFLKSKLRITTSEMSKQRVDELLQQRYVQQQVRLEFLGLLATAERARYAPSTATDMQQDYEKASRVINQLDKQLN
ncbi:BatD family protein [Nonlabens marinus]|uniref:Bacteroides aerotolerance protein BatD n=1 Tax=Nonlabens marinus S1-08 TaxID=1454201 RepID=W8VWP4_9FLAO|nr:BatD family protein [Nonlabens marinus]BAO54922.1 Bacteroides aerotolerance protein BatD [Nonlabens marinus S1-08]